MSEPSKLSEESVSDVIHRLTFHQGQLRPHWLKMDVFRLMAELAAKDEEIRRLRESCDKQLDRAAEDLREFRRENERLRDALGQIAADCQGNSACFVDEVGRRAAKAMEG